MAQSTKALELLKATGYDIWGTSEKELNQILTAMKQIAYQAQKENQAVDVFAKQWFDDTFEVDDDN